MKIEEWTSDESYWHEKRCGCSDPGSFYCLRSAAPSDPDWCDVHGWHMEPCCTEGK